MKSILTVLPFLIFACSAPLIAQVRKNVPRVGARITFSAPQTRQPKDMCVWVHPDESKKHLSTIITADDQAQMISVFDLEGRVLDALRVPLPGDLDVRYDFPLMDNKKVDIIAVLQRRNGNRVLIFTIDRNTRKLKRLDDDKIFCGTGATGGCLYRNPKTNQFYFFATGTNGEITQVELVPDNRGAIKGKRLPKRLKTFVDCRGAVADDFHGYLYVSDKRQGVWKFDARAMGSSKGKIIAKLGENGLLKDVEGLALYQVSGGHGYLIVCSEGSNRFLVYDREKNSYVGSFIVRGAVDSRYLDICAANIGSWYTRGILLCNTNLERRSSKIIGVPWESIAKGFDPNLGSSESWNPRKITAKRPKKK